MNLLETILEESLRLFKAEGIETYPEEMLLQKLDIRKSTYQELFRSKNDLVMKVLTLHIQKLKDEQKTMLGGAANPVEEILSLLRYGIDTMHSMNPLFLNDVQQHYPEVWALVLDYLNNYSRHLNAEIINRGILQGYFRRDINLQLVTKIMLEQFYMMINPMIFPPDRYSLPEVFRSIYLYYVRGICTEVGGKMAEEYFAKAGL
ncbi:TetR/AcrR family transcriptional regulator [Pontibacter sp. CAU 1760]